MTDEEIQEYVQNENIDIGPLSEREKEEIAEAGDAIEYEEAEPVDKPPDYAQELERLADLRAKGILTYEEFAAKKQILGIQVDRGLQEADLLQGRTI